MGKSPGNATIEQQAEASAVILEGHLRSALSYLGSTQLQRATNLHIPGVLASIIQARTQLENALIAIELDGWDDTSAPTNGATNQFIGGERVA